MMRKSKCRFCVEGIVLDEKCEKVIGHRFCDIDQYDEDIGCNKSCNGYSAKKEVSRQITIHTDNSKVIENLLKENAELRECLNEAIPWLADISAEVVGNEPAKQIDELVIKMRDALEGGNREKD